MTSLKLEVNKTVEEDLKNLLLELVIRGFKVKTTRNYGIIAKSKKATFNITTYWDGNKGAFIAPVIYDSSTASYNRVLIMGETQNPVEFKNIADFDYWLNCFEKEAK